MYMCIGVTETRLLTSVADAWWMLSQVSSSGMSY